MALWNHGVPRTVNGGVERESFGRSKPWKGGVAGRTSMPLTECAASRFQRGLCAFGQGSRAHRRANRNAHRAEGNSVLQEVVAVPITSVIGEKVPVSFHPHAVKGVSNTARKHAVVTCRRIDPKQSGVSVVCFIADVAC